jgi:hypothetical protein
VPPAAPDDRSIDNEADLLRRFPHHQLIRDDAAEGGLRPSSATFDDAELSVALSSECSLDELLVGHNGFGVVSFTAGQARAFGWGVVRAPSEDYPGHAHVTGKKTQGQRSRLAKACRILRMPESVN